MNGRFITFAAGVALVALVLSVGALMVLLFRPQPVAAQAGAAPIRQITVVGNGEANGTPDTAIVQLGVRTEGATAREALDSNNTQTEALIAKLKELGVADRDLQTSNLSVNPRYDEQGRTVVGYEVSNMLNVTIRNVAQSGALLDQVVDAGANQIWGLSFTIDDPTALQTTARDSAIADARARAEAMAKTAGGTLGTILSISETIGMQPPVPMYARAEMAQADSAVPVQPGEQTISAQVQVTFELR